MEKSAPHFASRTEAGTGRVVGVWSSRAPSPAASPRRVRGRIAWVRLGVSWDHKPTSGDSPSSDSSSTCAGVSRALRTSICAMAPVLALRTWDPGRTSFLPVDDSTLSGFLADTVFSPFPAKRGPRAGIVVRFFIPVRCGVPYKARNLWSLLVDRGVGPWEDARRT